MRKRRDGNSWKMVGEKAQKGAENQLIYHCPTLKRTKNCLALATESLKMLEKNL